MIRRTPRSTHLPYTTLFRSGSLQSNTVVQSFQKFIFPTKQVDYVSNHFILSKFIIRLSATFLRALLTTPGAEACCTPLSVTIHLCSSAIGSVFSRQFPYS